MNDAASFKAQFDAFVPNWDYGNLYRFTFGININLNR